MPVGRTEYNQVTTHGVGAGYAIHDLTATAGRLSLAKAKTYDLNPRTGTAWNAPLTANEVDLLEYNGPAELNSGGKIYAAALLLAHLRKIKTAAGTEALDANND